jgi:hypothetical protein
MSAPGSTVPSSEYHAALDRRDRREDVLLARITELEDCIRALIENAYEPAHVRSAVIGRALRTLSGSKG